MTDWKVAIQEDMLPGPTLEDRFVQAADLGLQGIEFWSEHLPGQVAEIERLSGQRTIVASSINNGRRSRFLDPDPEERDRALAELSEAIELAGRIAAAGVIFVPHFFGPLLPDLSPYKTEVELEIALLRAQLMALVEAADRAEVQLFVEPVYREETHLLNRLEQASSLIDPLGHDRLGIVADLFHMAQEELDIPAAILENRTKIGHVHLADSNRKLPGQGTTEFKPALEALEEIEYEGWLALECGSPGQNQGQAERYLAELPASLMSTFG
ncbi:MAG: sugar phosphate isomerase/epimerase [Anaerolineae bacterium]|nr:MAG: sugar phosphate isomerase/epimerase [Anaerolineae bacterium]